MKTLKIDSVSLHDVPYGKEVVIVSGKDKYQFYNTKKDGNQTKAFEQFSKYKFGIGDVVKVKVGEKAKSFTDPKGKNVNYTERTILYFGEMDNLPQVEKNNENEVDGPQWDKSPANEQIEAIPTGLHAKIELVCKQNEEILKILKAVYPNTEKEVY